jgi:hypothetical protein
MLSFEHVNFTFNEKYSKNIYDNPNNYASLVIFQTCSFKECPFTWVAPLIVFLPSCTLETTNPIVKVAMFGLQAH